MICTSHHLAPAFGARHCIGSFTSTDPAILVDPQYRLHARRRDKIDAPVLCAAQVDYPVLITKRGIHCLIDRWSAAELNDLGHVRTDLVIYIASEGDVAHGFELQNRSQLHGVARFLGLLGLELLERQLKLRCTVHQVAQLSHGIVVYVVLTSLALNQPAVCELLDGSVHGLLAETGALGDCCKTDPGCVHELGNDPVSCRSAKEVECFLPSFEGLKGCVFHALHCSATKKARKNLAQKSERVMVEPCQPTRISGCSCLCA